MRSQAAAFVIVALAAPAAFSQAQPYVAIQRTYSTNDVLAVFGPQVQKPPPPALAFELDVQAGVKTTMNCGQFGVNVNVGNLGSMVAKLPQQLVSQGNALLGAMPMLAICYASPSLCAELKNLNFQINEKVKGLTDVCKSVNQYINDQAIEGKIGASAQARGVQQCVDNLVEGGWDVESATEQCKDSPPPPLLTDIGQAWLKDVTTTGPQNVLSSLLSASGQLVDGMDQENYAFLAAMLGELKLDVNGKVLPIFPERPLTAQALSDLVKSAAVRVACDKSLLQRAVAGGLTPDLPNAAGRRYQRALYDAIPQLLTMQDVKNLFYLDAVDTALACNVLGRELGRLALERVSNESQATLVTAMQNPGLPPAVQAMYQARETSTFKALRDLIADRDVPSVPAWRAIVTRMAELKLSKTRSTAKALSRGKLDLNDLEWSQQCDDDFTCGPRATFLEVP